MRAKRVAKKPVPSQSQEDLRELIADAQRQPGVAAMLEIVQFAARALESRRESEVPSQTLPSAGMLATHS